MRLVLYQPDIPPNAGTLIRLGACLGVGVDIIEPCGFPLSDRSLKRAHMDYAEHADICRHMSWEGYLGQRPEKARLILLSTRAETAYTEVRYAPGDHLVVGRESAGVDAGVWQAVDMAVRIPMAPEARSLNVAVAAAMVLGEALRQIGGFPPHEIEETAS